MEDPVEDEEGKAEPPTMTAESAPHCEVCKQQIAKYKCPRCEKRTCSLACVKAHKEAESCNGKRNRAEYHSLLEFTDEDIHSDYHFLMDVERVADGAHREAYKSKLKYQHREQCIVWMVEWEFHPDSGAARVDNKLHENTKISDALGKYLDKSLGAANALDRQQLCNSAAIGVQDLRALLRVEPSKANAVTYYSLDIGATINEALRNKLVIEYPTIHIMSKQQADTVTVVPAPSMVPQATPEEFSSALGVDVSIAEQLPYARRRKTTGEFEGGRGGSHRRGRGRGHRGGDKRGRGGGRGGRGGRSCDNNGSDNVQGVVEQERGDEDEDGEPERLSLGGAQAESDSEGDVGETDLADPDLLRAIEGARSAEELLKMQAELDEQLAVHHSPHDIDAGAESQTSGLTPGVSAVQLSKHL